MKSDIRIEHKVVGAPHCHARSPQGLKVFGFLLLFLCVAGMLAACQSAPGKRYPLQAEVISVDAPRKLIVVKHGEIPGLMPAMTMSYAVLDAKDIESLHPGDKISAELVVADEKGHLEKSPWSLKPATLHRHPKTDCEALQNANGA